MFHLVIAISMLLSPETTMDNGLVVMTDIQYASSNSAAGLRRSLYMDVAFPQNATEVLPAIIFIHGGGWSRGKRQDGLRAIKMLAAGGYFVATVDYRLTDEGKFPAAVHDCNAAIRFIKTHATELCVDPKRIGLVGYSAGGHIATLIGVSTGTALIDGNLNGRYISTEVICIGSISGAVMPQLAKGGGMRVFEEWAIVDSSSTLAPSLPITYLDKDDPPIYLLCGSDDVVCPVRHTKKFVEHLDTIGIEHVIEILPKRGHSISDPRDFLGLLRFLDEHLGGQSAQALQDTIEKLKVSGRSR